MKKNENMCAFCSDRAMAPMMTMMINMQEHDLTQWRRQDMVQNYTKLFVAHKMTRNNTLNKVHV